MRDHKCKQRSNLTNSNDSWQARKKNIYIQSIIILARVILIMILSPTPPSSNNKFQAAHKRLHQNLIRNLLYISNETLLPTFSPTTSSNKSSSITSYSTKKHQTYSPRLTSTTPTAYVEVPRHVSYKDSPTLTRSIP